MKFDMSVVYCISTFFLLLVGQSLSKTIPESTQFNGLRAAENVKLWKEFSAYLNGFAFRDRNRIASGFFKLEEVLCIPFYLETRPPAGDYVFVKNNEGGECSSETGMQGGRQDLLVNPATCLETENDVINMFVKALGIENPMINFTQNELLVDSQKNLLKTTEIKKLREMYNCKD